MDLRAGAVRSVYVHAPFCSRRCNYCDFAVQVAKKGDVDSWLEAVGGEWANLRNEGWAQIAESLDTLYVGGGTPSHLGPSAMEGLADVLGRERLTSPDLEWTSEANPESFTLDVAKAWRQAGVNRISLGVQSFDETVLHWMGRLHGAEGAEAAVRTARAVGLENFSIDLIFGLPSRLNRDWEADLDRALALDPPHVSLYGLTVEPGTGLGRAVAEGREVPLDEESYRDEYLMAVERLTGAGYAHYEVSSFARDGLVSRHNSMYWSGAPYLGLGNGAHSFVSPVRRWNLREWDAYHGRAVSGESPVEEAEHLDASAVQLEMVWLRLRTSGGLPIRDLDPSARSAVERWVTEGLARTGAGHVSLTAEGWLVMDRLTVEMDDLLTGQSSLSDLGT